MPTKNTYKSFGEILKEKRKARGWSQERLATAANTCASVISGYERGRSIPGLYIALDIARALECTLEELVGMPTVNGRRADG